jgi:hypothetical protein
MQERPEFIARYGDLVPTVNEAVFLSLFGETEEIRAVARRLLAGGVARDDEEHPLLFMHRTDPEAISTDDIIDQLVESAASLDVELSKDEPAWAAPMLADAPVGPAPIPPAPELGRSMQALVGQDQPVVKPAPGKYFVAPRPAPPSTDQRPIPWLDDSTNSPLQ